MFAVAESWRHPDAEQMLGVEIRVVERIDVGAQRLADRMR